MPGYNSRMHRQVVRLKNQSAEERARFKRLAIREQEQKRREIEDPNPLRGLVGFLNKLKKIQVKSKGEQNEETNDINIKSGAVVGKPGLGVIEN